MKMAENQAIPIYRKYYRRYSARVKVNQIKKNEFKKWKYEALVKRDEYSAPIEHLRRLKLNNVVGVN